MPRPGLSIALVPGMRKTIVGISLLVGAAVPLSAKQFVASDAPHAGLKRKGKIVISNDDSAIRARHYAASKQTTLVELRSTRVRNVPPPAPAVARQAAPTSSRSVARSASTKGVPPELASIILDAARHYSIDARLLTAVARQESRFKPHAVSPVGARGVMQLMPATAAWLGVKNAFDPRQNIFGGAKYLKMMLDTFNGDVSLSLAAYNAGPGAVRKHRGIPPYRETKQYVAAIRRDLSLQ